MAALRVFQTILSNDPAQRIPQNREELYAMEHFEDVGTSDLPTEDSIDNLCEHLNLMPNKDRAADFFNTLRGPEADYDQAILAFEKLVAEYAPTATGEEVLEIMARAYRSAKARGTLGTLTNRASKLWKEGGR